MRLVIDCGIHDGLGDTDADLDGVDDYDDD